MHDTPLVSVIIPAYNAEVHIRRTVSSVLNQTYRNIEILVVDDGSDDSTAEIVGSMARRDKRIQLLKQSNLGVAAARNLAIKKSRGEFIAPLDADDIWYCRKLEKQVDTFVKADPQVGLVYCWCVVVNEDDKVLGHASKGEAEGAVLKALFFSNFLGNGSVPLIRRDCFEKIGLYSSRLKEQGAQGCEDWDIYLRIAEKYRYGVVREYLVGYRHVRDSMSKNYGGLIRSYELMVDGFKKKHPEIPEKIHRWSKSFLFLYYAGISYESGDFRIALRYALSALLLDPTTFLSPFLQRLIIKSLLKIGVDFAIPESWRKEGRPASPGRVRPKEETRFISLSDLMKKSKSKCYPWRPWNIYGRIRNRRWRAILRDSIQL
jgi:glycosyltransferase involved in cell wall biosynthesis